MYASAWQPWMSDALQAADISLTRAAVGDSGAGLELTLPRPASPVTARFNVKKWDLVMPSTVDRLPRLYQGDLPLLVVADRMSGETVDRLRQGRYSWLSRRPLPSGLRGELRTKTTVYAVWDTQSPIDPPPGPGRGRPGLAVGRLAQALFYLAEATQADLADETGISQARISQLLGEWPAGSGVTRIDGRPARWGVDNPDLLISMWLTAYVPEQRIPSYWYGLDSLTQQARTAVEALKSRAWVSGSLAADALAPWAVPQKVLIYTDEALDLSTAGFASSPQRGATLELVSTRDQSVVPSRQAQPFLAWAAKATALPLADPLVVLWDLTHSEDLDSDPAGRHLQARLVDTWRELHHG